MYHINYINYLKATIIISSILLFVGCGSYTPLQPGDGTLNVGSMSGTIKQAENPSQTSSQNITRTEELVYYYPDYKTITNANANISGAIFTNGIILKKTITEQASTDLGASQKDNTRGLAAKLQSMKPIMYGGMFMFALGIVCVFYGPARLLLGGLTPGIAILAGGLIMMILPTIIAGNELLIAIAVLGIVGLYIWTHRHGKLQGIVDTVKK